MYLPLDETREDTVLSLHGIQITQEVFSKSEINELRDPYSV